MKSRLVGIWVIGSILTGLLMLSGCSDEMADPCYECIYTNNNYDTTFAGNDTTVTPGYDTIVACYTDYLDELGNESMTLEDFERYMAGTEPCSKISD